ncbi:MAG: periplasmic heavy metal sensor [Alphaproteobacteria bacterium]|nr:periplasmic heavy metal sensor [Alphaproteobacteria bacterium]
MILLFLSVALNLLFIGAAVARYFVHEPHGRISGISEMQLIPRKFFGDVSASRRSELAQVFKGYRVMFRDGREARRKMAVDLADALAAEPYDEIRARSAILAFNQKGAELMGHGGDAAVDFIGKLSPEERKLLAQRIRERAGAGSRKRD